MTLPIDLVLVRHGQSEGNAAKRLSEAGHHEVFTPEFRDRHSSALRLTDLGRLQASVTGKWIQDHFPKFDRYYVSEYLRAMETAALLELPEARWFTDPYLTERDWGEIESLPENERNERFGAALRKRESDPFFWRPPNGETFVDLCLRVDRVLDTLHRECSDMRVIIVCHGEVMRAFQVRIERMSQARFRELTLSARPEDRIYNCEVIHYSRRRLGSEELTRSANWVNRIRPASDPAWTSGWQEIVRSARSNRDLLKRILKTPQLVK